MAEVDYDALAAKFGGKSVVDYEAIASKFGGKEVAAEKPSRSTGEAVARQVGLTVRHGVEGAANLLALPGTVYDAFADAAGIPGPRFRSNEAVSKLLDKMGLPTTENAQERVVGDVAKGMAGAGGSIAIARSIAAAASPVVAKIGTDLAASPGMQVASAGTGSGAAGVTREAGGGPEAQLAAALAGAAAPATATAAGSELIRRGVRGGDAGRQNMADRIQTFEAAGAEPSVGQASGNRAVQAVESGLAKSPGSAGTMVKAGEEQAASMGAKVDEIANSVSPNPSAARAGAQIEKGLGQFAQRFRANQAALYDNLDKVIPADTRVPVANLSKTLDELTTPIRGAEATSELMQVPKLNAIREAIAKDAGSVPGQPGSIPYQAVKDLRSEIGKKLSNPSLVDDVDRATWKQLYGALSQDMGEAAKQAGPLAERLFQRANDFTRAGHARIETFLDRVAGKDTVEKIFQAAVNPSELREGASTVSAVMKSLEPEQRQAVSAAVVKRMGIANPGNQNDLGELFSSQTFLTNWNKISPEAKRTLFAGSQGNDLRQSLDKIAEAASMVREGSKVFANPSGTAQAISNQTAGLGVTGAAALGRLDVAGTLVGAMTAAHVGAKLLTNPATARWLARATTLSGGMPPAQLETLNEIAGRQKDSALAKEAADLVNELRGKTGTK